MTRAPQLGQKAAPPPTSKWQLGQGTVVFCAAAAGAVTKL
jgi:hypothetical protein